MFPPLRSWLPWTVGLVGVLLALFVFAWRRPVPPKIDPATQHVIDSLRVTADGFRHQADSALGVVRIDTIRAAARVVTKTKVVADAAALGRLADSLARVADSAATWQRAYTVRTLERDTLQVALALADTALLFERDARGQLQLLYAQDTARRAALERVSAGLQRDIARLQQPCKLIGPLPCPSRTVTLIAGAALGLVATRALGR